MKSAAMKILADDRHGARTLDEPQSFWLGLLS